MLPGCSCEPGPILRSACSICCQRYVGRAQRRTYGDLLSRNRLTSLGPRSEVPSCWWVWTFEEAVAILGDRGEHHATVGGRWLVYGLLQHDGETSRRPEGGCGARIRENNQEIMATVAAEPIRGFVRKNKRGRYRCKYFQGRSGIQQFPPLWKKEGRDRGGIR